MKTKKYFILLLIIVACVFVSCKQEIAEDTVEYCIPDFSAHRGLTSLGTGESLSGMEDNGIAHGVLQIMPIFANLQKVKVNKNQKLLDAVKGLYNANNGKQYSDILKSYGLHCRLVFNNGLTGTDLKEVSYTGSDGGTYLYYEILDPNDDKTVIGYFDYYTKKDKFSYRDMVLLDVHTDALSPTDIPKDKRIVYTRGFKDVPITYSSNGYPTFNVGRLEDKNKTGVPVFEDDNYVDNFGIKINERDNGTQKCCFGFYERNVITAMSKGDITAAIVRPDYGVWEELDEMFKCSTGEIIPEITDLNTQLVDVFAYNDNEDWKLRTTHTNTTATDDLDQAFSAAEIIYGTNASTLKDYIFTLAGNNYKQYENYEAYTDKWLKTRCQLLEDNLKTGREKYEALLEIDSNFFTTVTNLQSVSNHSRFFIQLLNLHTMTLDNATVIDAKNKKATSMCADGVEFPLVCGYPYFYTSIQSLQAFGDFYPEITSKYSSQDLLDISNALAKAHLHACGINDQNYIDNFVYASRNCGLLFIYKTDASDLNNLEKIDNRISAFYLKQITCEKSSDWVSDYDLQMNKLISDLTTTTDFGPGNGYVSIRPVVEGLGTLTYYGPTVEQLTAQM